MTGGQRPAELLRRYSVDDLAIFTDPEKLRFLDSGPPDPQVNAKLAWQLLYRLEPGLYERLARAEQVHPSVLDWLPARVERIVEVGAGTGRLTTELATRCDELIAVEPAAPMRWILSTKLHALGAGSHWHVIDGLFDSLPLPDRWASLVVACSSLTETIAQGGAAGLSEMERICSPGGQVVIVWPGHLEWLQARGYRHQRLPSCSALHFPTPEEAEAVVSVFYPEAAAEVRRRGGCVVPYSLLGAAAPRDLAYKTVADQGSWEPGSPDRIRKPPSTTADPAT